MTLSMACDRDGWSTTPLLPAMGAPQPTPLADIDDRGVIREGGPDRAPWLFLPATGRWLELAPLPFVVGSAGGCDLRIAGAGLSRRHAVFEAGAGCYRVKDLCSRAGLRVNGQPVRQVALAEGDRLHLAGIEVIFAGSRTALPAAIAPRQRRGRGQRWRGWLSVVLALSLTVGYGSYRFQSKDAGASPPARPASAMAGSARVSGRPPPAQRRPTRPERRPPAAQGAVQKPVPLVEAAPAAVHTSVGTLTPYPAVGSVTDTSVPPECGSACDGALAAYGAGAMEDALRQLQLLAADTDSPDQVRQGARRVRQIIATLASTYGEGRALLDAGRSEAGFAVWARFLRLEATLDLPAPSAQSETIRARTAAYYGERGNAALAADDSQQAYRLWRRAAELEPQGASALALADLEGRARALFREGYRLETVDLRRAVALWRSVRKLVPPGTEYHTRATARLRWYADREGVE